MKPAPPWYEIDIAVAGVEEVRDRCRQILAAHGIGDVAENFPAHDTTTPIAASLVAYSQNKPQLLAIQAAISALFPDTKVRLHPMPDSLWQHSWQADAVSFTTDRFHVSWQEQPDGPTDKICLPMATSRAFGNGQHATTQAVMEVLEKAPVGESFLDVGAGTGILCLAAHYLGYQKIVATDIDPVAIEDCENFFQQHGVQGTALLGSFPEQGSFDVIACNVLYPELQNLTAQAAAYLKSGGLFLTAGLIEKDEPTFTDFCAQQNLKLKARHATRHWLCLSFCKQ